MREREPFILLVMLMAISVQRSNSHLTITRAAVRLVLAKVGGVKILAKAVPNRSNPVSFSFAMFEMRY